MTNFSKKIMKNALNALVMNKVVIGAFNKWYESAPHSFSQRIEPALRPPSFDYTWRIKVGDKKIRFTYLENENRFIFHFPLSYKKNDPPIKQLEKILHEHYPRDNYFLDIGANFGLRSLYYLAHQRPCVLFEPNAECNAITERLIKENGFTNLTLVKKMVGAENSLSDFYLSNSSYVSSASKEYVEQMNDFKETIEVEQITIDSFIAQEALQHKAKIAKIDVEGYEYEVCLGAKDFLSSENVSLVIEILPSAVRSAQVFDLLKHAGHSIYCIKKQQQLRLLPCKENFDSSDGSIDYFTTNDRSLIEKLKPFIQ